VCPLTQFPAKLAGRIPIGAVRATIGRKSNCVGVPASPARGADPSRQEPKHDPTRDFASPAAAAARPPKVEAPSDPTTISGIPIKRVYTPEDTRGIDYGADIGEPGQPPFTRGMHPDMYRGRMWTMRQFAGFGTAAQTNQRFKYLLEKGQTGLSTAFDLPTLMGRDSDDRWPWAR